MSGAQLTDGLKTFVEAGNSCDHVIYSTCYWRVQCL